MPSMSNSLVTGILEFSHLKSGVASVVLSVPMVLMASCELVPAMFDPETKQVISIQDKLVHRKKIWS